MRTRRQRNRKEKEGEEGRKTVSWRDTLFRERRKNRFREMKGEAQGWMNRNKGSNGKQREEERKRNVREEERTRE